jgi:hypothetical protein
MFERANGAEEIRDHRIAAPPFSDFGAFVADREAEFAQEQIEDRESLPVAWELETPFLAAANSGSAAEATAPELEAFAELTAELKDPSFRESLEQLVEEALESHAEQLAGEYGDRESRDASAQRLLEDHFRPVASQAHAMLDRFFERLEGYEAEALTDTVIARAASEVSPTGTGFSPASEQFLGGLLDKARRAVSGAVNLAKRGIKGAVQLAGKLALGPLLDGLKKLASFLLRHVVRFALDKIPPSLRPLAQKLSDRLFQALGQSHEHETGDHEHGEAALAAPDAARLEAEFDLELAQLLLTPDETEIEHQLASYGEAESGPGSLAELDRARGQFAGALERLEPGESAQPAMEQFLPAAWPVLKTALTVLGRKNVVDKISQFVSKLIQPMLGAEGAAQLAPALADAGLRVFGLETADPRSLAAEALTATVEETLQSLSELPPYALHNETLLETAVREAFENAATTYFPPTMIKPELRETADEPGIWSRMPVHSHRKRYAKYSGSPEVTIPPRLAASVRTFDGATLADHLRDRMNITDGRPVKTNIRLYQVLPGTTAAHIARAEGIQPQDLHPLTHEAAGALLGRNAALASRGAWAHGHHHGRSRLHKRQRLYYIEPPGGRHHRHRHHRHARIARSELLINLAKGQIVLWLYLSEALCQQVSVQLAKGQAVPAFRLVKPLLHRAAEMVRLTVLERKLPPHLRVIGDKPNLDARVPVWLSGAGKQLADKIEEWASQHIASYIENHAEEFRRVSASEHDGMTLRIVMNRVPGIETLRLAAQGQTEPPKDAAWLTGQPAVTVDAHQGHTLK